MAALISSYVKRVSIDNLKQHFEHSSINNLILSYLKVRKIEGAEFSIKAMINGHRYFKVIESGPLVKAWQMGEMQDFETSVYNTWDDVVLDMLGHLPKSVPELIKK